MYRLNKAYTKYVYVIFPQLKGDINQFDGNIKPESKYYGMSVKKLFLDNNNIIYLTIQLSSLLLNARYVGDHLLDNTYGPDFLVNNFKKNINQIKQFMVVLIEEFPMPNYEDISYNNIPYNLSELNKDFLKQSANTIINNPNILIRDIFNINPDTGDIEYGQASYDPSSYVNGWKPEDLFLNTAENRKNPYWEPYAFGIDSTYKDTSRNNVYNIDENGMRFPYWQVTPQHRHYDRDNQDLTYSYGAIADNATGRNRSYDMTALRAKSTY